MKLNPGKLTRQALLVFAAGVVTWAFCQWRGHTLPPTRALLGDLKSEPLQTPLTTPEFTETRNGYSYQIIPKYSYLIRGLVVEENNSFAWYDITHINHKDYLNTRDLCVVWGDDAFSPYLGRMSFSHGDWTCYFQTRDSEAWGHFRQNQISNNHLIPATPEIARAIADAEISDQIEAKGYLADYVNRGFTRHTSITRDDVGDGACEIIYVTEFNILERTNRIWFKLRTIAKFIAAFGFMTALLAFFALPYFPSYVNEDLN